MIKVNVFAGLAAAGLLAGAVGGALWQYERVKGQRDAARAEVSVTRAALESTAAALAAQRAAREQSAAIAEQHRIDAQSRARQIDRLTADLATIGESSHAEYVDCRGVRVPDAITQRLRRAAGGDQ